MAKPRDERLVPFTDAEIAEAVLRELVVKRLDAIADDLKRINANVTLCLPEELR